MLHVKDREAAVSGAIFVDVVDAIGVQKVVVKAVAKVAAQVAAKAAVETQTEPEPEMEMEIVVAVKWVVGQAVIQPAVAIPATPEVKVIPDSAAVSAAVHPHQFLPCQ